MKKFESPDQPTRHRVVNFMVAGAFIILLGVLGLFLKWSFEDEHILEIKNDPFPTQIINDPSGNKIVILHANYCKNRTITGKVRTSYVSQTNEVLSPIADENGPKTCQELDLPMVLPKDLPADKYKIKFRVTYSLNPLKKEIVNEFYSTEFEVK